MEEHLRIICRNVLAGNARCRIISEDDQYNDIVNQNSLFIESLEQ